MGRSRRGAGGRPGLAAAHRHPRRARTGGRLRGNAGTRGDAAMKLRNVIAMARKEVRHLVRDARSLALMFLLPAMMLFIYGYAIRLDIVHAPIGLLQEDLDAPS